VLLFLALSMLLCGSTSMAADVAVRWDPNNPTPEGYRVFMRDEAGSYDYSQPAWQGPETTTTLTGLTEDQTYALVVRAYDGEMESADSNEVVYTPPAQQRVIRGVSPTGCTMQ